MVLHTVFTILKSSIFLKQAVNAAKSTNQSQLSIKL